MMRQSQTRNVAENHSDVLQAGRQAPGHCMQPLPRRGLSGRAPGPVRGSSSRAQEARPGRATHRGSVFRTPPKLKPRAWPGPNIRL